MIPTVGQQPKQPKKNYNKYLSVKIGYTFIAPINGEDYQFEVCGVSTIAGTDLILVFAKSEKLGNNALAFTINPEGSYSDFSLSNI